MLKERPGHLKDVVIKIKSLQQKIRPITIGAGASRPYIYVVFDQEANKQFAPQTLVYLSWKHLGHNKTIGYNVFTQIADRPKNVWKIALPQSLLKEGTVLARIELVDNHSIAASTNFEINVLYNPNEEECFTDSPDYTDFQKAVLELTRKVNEAKELMDNTQKTIDDLNELFDHTEELYHKLKKEQCKTNRKADKALKNSFKAYEAAMKALNQLIWGEIEVQ